MLVSGVQQSDSVIFFQIVCGYSVFPTPFVEKTNFLDFIAFPPSSEISWLYFCGSICHSVVFLYLWDLYSLPRIYLLFCKYYTIFFAVIQSPGRVQLFMTPWTAAYQASLFLIISWGLPKFMSIESVMPWLL